MAGLFERMGLVRTEYEGMPEIPMQPVSEPMYAPETPVIDATQVSYDDVIASIYQQGDIDDENSIFKIKAYIDILPQDMTKAKKQASIAGILSVNGINVDDLIEDGLKRGRAIKLTRDEIVAIRWHMGSFDCAVKGGDYGMGNAFETYPLAVMTHLADMEATYLVEGLAAK